METATTPSRLVRNPSYQAAFVGEGVAGVADRTEPTSPQGQRGHGQGRTVQT
jgi:hypothetical protein